MSQIAHQPVPAAVSAESKGAVWSYQLLYVAYVAVPLIAGLDKFFHLLTEWEMYLAPVFPTSFGVSPELFMRGAGVIEVLIALFVLVRPRDGAYVLVVWLGCVVLNLAIHPANTSIAPAARMWDIAFRDFGLMIGALVFGWLARDRNVQAERSLSA